MACPFKMVGKPVEPLHQFPKYFHIYVLYFHISK